MTKALKTFEEKIDKLDNRIADLKELNRQDGETLRKIESDYELAVNDFQSKRIDKLHDEISVIKQAIDNHSRQINILEKPDNPARIQARNEFIAGLESDRAAIRKQIDALHKEAMEAKEAYLLIASKAVELNRSHVAADRALQKAQGRGGYGEGHLDVHAYKIEVNEITTLGGK